MHPTVEEFRSRAQDRYGFDVDVYEFADGTKTAADAAEAVDCDLAQIVKSIVMTVDGRPVLVLTNGAHRVDETKLAAEFDVDSETVGMATADEVTAATGWSIGGVPPFCHDTALPTLADPAFESYGDLWAAAGTPDTVFPITTHQLVEFADPRIVDVYE